MKKLFNTLVASGLATLALFGMASCETVNGETLVYAKEDARTIAILKYGEHTSLNEIEDGVVDTISNELGSDYKINSYNCNFDAALINSTINKIKDDDLACIVAIATPVAAAAVNTFIDIPVVFAAVSDPEASDIVGYNVTGTSDAMQLSNLVDLAYEVIPETTKLGYIYTETEANSLSNKAKLEKLAREKNFTLVSLGIDKASNANTALKTIIDQGIDGLIVSDDNNVASMMSTLSITCANANVPMYCAADSEVKDGGMMGYSISYSALANKTGEQVLEIVKDRKAVKDVPVKYFDQPSDLNLYYNSSFFELSPTLKDKIPASLLATGTDLAE